MIQVAFAGHNRPDDLGDHAPLVVDLASAFDLLKQAGVGRARLLTGLASGADRLAAAAWREAGLGPAHAIFPFLDEPDPAGDGPKSLAQSATWLDGAASETRGRNPHLQQTRMLVGTVDLLVVVWTGEQARGAGGTADAVRLALELGLPVLWIRPGSPTQLRLLRPEKLAAEFDFSEFQEWLQASDGAHIEMASAASLRGLLKLDLEPSEDEVETEPQAAPSWADDWLHGWLWKTYAGFRRLLGGPRVRGAEGPSLPGDLASQPGFALLTEAYQRADLHANRLSAVHRSEQILLLLVMVTAAFVGSLPWLEPTLHLPTSAIELGLGLIALAVWTSAQRARQHERWGESRLLAEQLRVDRAGWALGVSLLGSPLTRMMREDGDLSRDYLRAAGLPHGKFDRSRIESWGAWAMNELVGGQAAYHRAISQREGRIAHRIHVIENASFLLLLLSLFGFVLAEFAAQQQHDHVPHWIAGVVSIIGTVVPAVGAATMALEAKLEIKEQSERSRRIAARLEQLATRVGSAPSHEDLQAAARVAMRWLVAEASHWRQGVGRRQLFRP